MVFGLTLSIGCESDDVVVNPPPEISADEIYEQDDSINDMGSDESQN